MLLLKDFTDTECPLKMKITNLLCPRKATESNERLLKWDVVVFPGIQMLLPLLCNLSSVWDRFVWSIP